MIWMASGCSLVPEDHNLERVAAVNSTLDSSVTYCTSKSSFRTIPNRAETPSNDCAALYNQNYGRLALFPDWSYPSQYKSRHGGERNYGARPRKMRRGVSDRRKSTTNHDAVLDTLA